MNEKYTVRQLSIGDILGLVNSKSIAIPEIQRPFVWDASKVRDLIDSLFNGYPTGYLIIWQKPNIRMKNNFDYSKGAKILIDGQQRVTALMASILGYQIINKDYEKVQIRIAFNPFSVDESDKFMVQTPIHYKDKRWVPDISVIFKNDFDIVEFVQQYCEYNSDITTKEFGRIITRLKSISSRQIGIIELDDSIEIDEVTEIFKRINSQGKPLNQADFVMSTIASDEKYGGNILRKVIDYFCHLAVKPDFYNYISIKDKEFMESEYAQKLQWLKDDRETIFDVDEANKFYTSVDGVLYDKGKKVLRLYPVGKKEGDYAILKGTIEIAPFAFAYNTSLASITIPDSVTKVGESAFRYCSSLRNITIPSGSSVIEADTFSGCTSLKNIIIPETVEMIGYWAFSYCTSLNDIIIPGNVTSIENGAFENCTSLKNIIIPENVKMIGLYAFSDCTSLTDITVPGNVASIESGTFKNCTSLTSAIVSDGVQIIKTGAFSGCTSIKSIFIPESLEIIESQTFELCSSLVQIDVDEKNASYSSINGILFDKDKTILIQYPLGRKDKAYTIPNGVASLGEYSFAECKTLTAIAIPRSLENLGTGAFYNCSNLVSATFFGDAPNQIDYGVFDGVAANFKTYTKKGTTGWEEDIRGMFPAFPEEDYD